MPSCLIEICMLDFKVQTKRAGPVRSDPDGVNRYITREDPGFRSPVPMKTGMG